GRWIAGGAALMLVGVVSVALVLAFGRGGTSEAQREGARLAPPGNGAGERLNGGGDINSPRRLATRIGSFGYRIEHVTKANRFDYKETSVFFEPGGAALAQRLANQLGCGKTSPPPGRQDARPLVV